MTRSTTEGDSIKLIVAGTLALGVVSSIVQPGTALAWGDDGHKVVALIAQSLLVPDVSKRVNALLAADTDSLTPHDIASAATWADKVRDSNVGGARQRTRQWHFVDIELTAPDLDQACLNHPSLPAGTVASNGPADDCVVDIASDRNRAPPRDLPRSFQPKPPCREALRQAPLRTCTALAPLAFLMNAFRVG